ncbi:hydroxyethylthiazole kinase [Numidum massiliense]|uniref:hydroxyethylthiazole kinase n=1 Tax=Numidum massiliense TaxID=1522315 RepID=UPI0006D56425|nr:hydroxyethylthiazole kinase [Numidum massiliense]
MREMRETREQRIRGQLQQLRQALRAEKPLIHNITNDVVTNFTANGTLAIGASPVMSSEPDEVAEMVAHADALVLNAGTLTTYSLQAMLLAGQAANRLGVPVVLDPVGYGTTSYRNAAIDRIMREVTVSVVRGNAAEIAALCQMPWQQKGVDAATDGGDPLMLAETFVRRYHLPVAITGKVDIIADESRLVTVANGHPLLPYITGSGCLATALIGAYAAVTDDGALAAIAGLCSLGLAAERAAAKAVAEKTTPQHALQHTGPNTDPSKTTTSGTEAVAAIGPGELNWRLLDELYFLKPMALVENAQIECVK